VGAGVWKEGNSFVAVFLDFRRGAQPVDRWFFFWWLGGGRFFVTGPRKKKNNVDGKILGWRKQGRSRKGRQNYLAKKYKTPRVQGESPGKPITNLQQQKPNWKMKKHLR